MPLKTNDDFILKEKCRRDEKYLTIYDTYTPNYHKDVPTPKFYSKYEALLGTSDVVNPEIMKNLMKACDWGPKMKHEWPETTNQEYGWFSDLFEMDRSDPRFYFPRLACEITKIGMVDKIRRKKKD